MSEHYRVGPGKCKCGFDAYKIDGIMLDYGELLMSHLRSAQERDRTARATSRAAERDRVAELESKLGAAEARTARLYRLWLARELVSPGRSMTPEHREQRLAEYRSALDDCRNHGDLDDPETAR